MNFPIYDTFQFRRKSEKSGGISAVVFTGGAPLSSQIQCGRESYHILVVIDFQKRVKINKILMLALVYRVAQVL